MLKRKRDWEFGEHVSKKSRGLHFFINIFFLLTPLSTAFLSVGSILHYALDAGEAQMANMAALDSCHSKS